MTKIGRGIKVEVEYFWNREKIIVFLDFSIFFFSSNYRVSASINASTRSELIIESIGTVRIIIIVVFIL